MGRGKQYLDMTWQQQQQRYHLFLFSLFFSFYVFSLVVKSVYELIDAPNTN
jgi:muramidase (phage lysozyme)